MEDLTQAAPPCRITLTSGEVFIVLDVNAWEGQDGGILAIGTWAGGSKTERTILFPHEQIRYVEYDFAALRAWQDEQVAEVEEKAA